MALTLRSYQEFRYRAAVSPRNNASGTAITAVTPARKSVFLSLGPMSSATERERSTPDAARPEKEVPKSPFKTDDTQSRYLMGAGLSRPSSRLKAATVSSVAACPNTASPKSPGSNEIELNIMADTTNSVATPSPSRFNIVASTGCKIVLFLLGPCLKTTNLVKCRHKYVSKR